MLLFLRNGLQRCLLHRLLALLLGLRSRIPLLRRLLLDVMRAAVHRVQVGRDLQSAGELLKRIKVLRFQLFALLRGMRRWIL